MFFTDLVDEECIHLDGVGLLMVKARAKASNAVAFYRFQYTQYMLRRHTYDGNLQHLDHAEKTLQRCAFFDIFCISVCVCGWTLDETNARAAVQKAPGNLSQIKDFQTDQGI